MSTLRMTLAVGLTALSTVFAPLGAQAQETTPTNAAAGIPAERQVVTAEEALELSRPSCDTCPGRVVLHVGEGFRERTLRSGLSVLSENNISPILVYGNPEPRIVEVYVSGNVLLNEDGQRERDFSILIASVINARRSNILIFANSDNQNSEPSLTN
ncbi:MAG: hypothetical protein ACK4VI_04330 [Alphaproteobacteria bacterium]